jgi:lysophospholipase L1-like esterase
MRTFTALFCAAILAFGLYSEDWQSLPWAGIALLTFGAPLALQAVKSSAWRVYGIWFGAFVVLQSLLTPLLRGDYVTLPADMKVTVDVRSDAIPGFPRGLRQVTTDARGWRVQPPVDYAAKAPLRIVAIGGSTTEDILLDDRSTWTHRLQQLLATDRPGVQVINTGVSGLRAANHKATLQATAALQPDLVLILLGGNDWNKHIKDHFEPGRDGWKPLPFRLTALPLVINRLVVMPLRKETGAAPGWTQRAQVINGPEDLNGGRRFFPQRQPLERFEPAAVAASYQADLQSIAALCRERSLRCVWMSQAHGYGPPSPSAELAKRFWMTPPYADYGLELTSMAHVARLYNHHLAAFAAQAGQPFCDLAAGMRAEPAYFYDDMHYTDEGAKRVAELVAGCVRPLLAGLPLAGASR